MYKSYIGFFLLTITLLLTTGCGGKYKKVEAPVSELLNDKDKAYIIFARRSAGAYMMSNIVMEYDPANLDDSLNLVATLGPRTQTIYAVDPGTHYFYMRSAENGDKIKTTVEAGKVYYVSTWMHTGFAFYRFNFVPYHNYTDMNCTKDFLENASFEERRSNSRTRKDVSTYKNDDDVIITCTDGIVSHMSFFEMVTTVENYAGSLKNFTNEKKGYAEQIRKDLNSWDISLNELNASDGFLINDFFELLKINQSKKQKEVKNRDSII